MVEKVGKVVMVGRVIQIQFIPVAYEKNYTLYRLTATIGM